MINTTKRGGNWTFLSNHGHVLVSLARDPDARLRDVATAVGITERAVQRIVAELEQGGVLTRAREGRRNHYTIDPSLSLRHAVEGSSTVGDLLSAMDIRVEPRPARGNGVIAGQGLSAGDGDGDGVGASASA